MTTALLLLLLASPPQVDCIYTGLCCQWEGLRYSCGFKLHCRGKQTAQVVDGGIMLGECR